MAARWRRRLHRGRADLHCGPSIGAAHRARAIEARKLCGSLRDRPPRGEWRAAVPQPAKNHAAAIERPARSDPAGAAALARGDQNCGSGGLRRSADSAGGLLRHGFPPPLAGIGAALSLAQTAFRRRHPPLRLSRPVLRILLAGARAGGTAAPPDHRPFGQRSEFGRDQRRRSYGYVDGPDADWGNRDGHAQRRPRSQHPDLSAARKRLRRVHARADGRLGVRPSGRLRADVQI